MATVDALILLTFVAFAIHAGWRARRQASQNLTEYFLADRSLSGWSAGISMAATLLASALAAPVLLFVTPELGEAARLLAMAVIATMAGVGASLAFGPEPKSHLEAFWQRVQPPGFWQPFDDGRGRRRLARGLIATAAAALSLFCAVGGIASWGLSSPPPTWLPSRPAWIALLLVTSLALLPWWWRAAVRGPREGISTPT